MNRPLSDIVPLRNTSVWPGYDAIAIIPRVYGRARVRPLRYTEAGTAFVLADHPLVGVDAVTLDGEPIDYRWRNGADMTGHAAAFLELAEAPDTSATLSAEVRGLSGNPADIIADLYPRPDLQDFAVHCRNAGLELGGAFVDKTTTRAAIQFVLEQVGAVWSAGLPGFAIPFPPPTDGPLWATFGRRDIAGWTAECTLSSIVTRVSVPFDWDYADDKALQSIVLEAPDAIRTHGEREEELALPWVRSARQAVSTATTWLQWRSKPLWNLQFSSGTQNRAIQPGGWIVVNHPQLPYSGLYVVTDVDPGFGRGGVTISAQASSGATAPIVLVRQSAVFPSITTDYSVSQGGDTVTLSITDETGKKLPGAKVWIDGKGPQTADAEAKIRFRAAPGRHAIRIEVDGRAAINTEISL